MKLKKGRLTSKAGILTFGISIAQLVTLLSTIVLARILTKENLGTYKQVFLTYQIIAPIFITGVPASILYFLPRFKKQIDKKLFAARSIALLVILGLFLGV